jgi:molybdopterin synthase catalytic subunit
LIAKLIDQSWKHGSELTIEPKPEHIFVWIINLKETLMIDSWIEDVKQRANPEELGMILVHNGIVRGTSKSGKPVSGMKLSYNQEKLNSVIPTFKRKPGVVEVKVWINVGNLKVGDNIMFLLVAGKFKANVLPVLEELLSLIKSEIVTEEEVR